MITTIIIVILNLLFFFVYPKKKKSYNNDYIKDKYIFIRKKVFKMLMFTNIINVIAYIIYLTIYLYDNDIELYGLIAIGVQLLTVLPILKDIKKYNKKNKIIEKKDINTGDILLLISIFMVSFIEKINSSYIYFIDVIGTILLVISLILITIEIIKLKNYVCYSAKEDNYLPDIGFTKKIELNKVINYFIYILIFILFILIKFNYAYMIIAIVLSLFAYNTFDKIKIMSKSLERINQSITIANEAPGVEFAFFFKKELLLMRKKLIIIIGATLSVILFYGLGDRAFVFTAFSIYNLLLYVLLMDKYSLIKYIKTLNKNLIDTDVYSIKVNKKVTYCDEYKLLGIKLYKLIVVDNLVYESNEIMYDPELYIKNIDIKINKNNLNDYIFNERILYEDDIKEISKKELEKMKEEEEEEN